MGLFVVNNGDFPNCEEVQQLRCSIFFPHVVPMSLIKKKTKGENGIIAYNTLFGISVMKIHLELLITFVEEFATIDNILRSQTSGANEGCRAMQVAKKRSKVTPCAILAFLGAKLLTIS
jgi:hypothetical protein